MTFDLARAMAKKQEVESARLDDFDFRLRARAMRLLAEALALDPDALVAEIAHRRDQDTITRLSSTLGVDGAEIHATWRSCLARARAALIVERGDPTPQRLA